MRMLVQLVVWCGVVRMRESRARALDGSDADDRLRGQFREEPHRAWLGCLVAEDAVPDVKYRDYRCTIVLVQPRTAVTIAHQLAGYSLAAPEVQAMFLEEDMTPMFCLVSSYIVHPEYEQGIKNTIALLLLEHFNHDYEWTPLSWALHDVVPDNTIFVGISLLHGVIQFYQNVTRVAAGTCDVYYRRIGLSSMYQDIGQISTSVTCYKEERLNKHSCLYEAGYPLLHQVNGIYVLAALSLKGPGCSNPSRFISLRPYRDFILNTSSTRRGWKRNPDQGMEDFYDDLDKSRIPYLFGKQPRLYTDKSGRTYQHGDCGYGKRVRVYREETKYKTTARNTKGIYVLTLHDKIYKYYRCIKFTCICKRMSHPDMWFTTIEDKHDLDPYIYKVPIKYLNRTIPPKVIFLMDDFAEYYNVPVVKLHGVFEFDHTAQIFVEYFGRD